MWSKSQLWDETQTQSWKGPFELHVNIGWEVDFGPCSPHLAVALFSSLPFLILFLFSLPTSHFPLPTSFCSLPLVPCFILPPSFNTTSELPSDLPWSQGPRGTLGSKTASSISILPLWFWPELTVSDPGELPLLEKRFTYARQSDRVVYIASLQCFSHSSQRLERLLSGIFEGPSYWWDGQWTVKDIKRNLKNVLPPRLTQTQSSIVWKEAILDSDKIVDRMMTGQYSSNIWSELRLNQDPWKGPLTSLGSFLTLTLPFSSHCPLHSSLFPLLISLLLSFHCSFPLPISYFSLLVPVLSSSTSAELAGAFSLFLSSF